MPYTPTRAAESVGVMLRQQCECFASVHLLASQQNVMELSYTQGACHHYRGGQVNQRMTCPCLQEGNVIMQPDGEVDIPVRRPDGDVELKGAGEHFFFPPCSNCGGILKPNVVFFGDTIPKPRALRCVREQHSACMACCGQAAQ